VDRIIDPLLFRKSGSAGNRTRTSGSVARNSDHQATEAVTLRDYTSEITTRSRALVTFSLVVAWLQLSSADVPFPLDSRTVPVPQLQQLSRNSLTPSTENTN
jgi:hypothetical protein